MNKTFLTLLSLGVLATAPLAEAARVSVDLGGQVIQVRDGDRGRWDRDRDRGRWGRDNRHGYRNRRYSSGRNRLISETRRYILEPDGDRVVITRRVYRQPDGDRIVRESRRVINR